MIKGPTIRVVCDNCSSIIDLPFQAVDGRSIHSYAELLWYLGWRSDSNGEVCPTCLELELETRLKTGVSSNDHLR